MTETITIPQAAMDELLAVRDTGATNMFDRLFVLEIATNLAWQNDSRDSALAEWSRSNPDSWGSLIMGSVPVEVDGS